MEINEIIARNTVFLPLQGIPGHVVAAAGGGGPGLTSGVNADELGNDVSPVGNFFYI